MERETRPMGFSSDPERSTASGAVFSKEMTEGWDLCLSPEPLVWYPGRKDGQAGVILSVQAKRHRKPVRQAKWDQLLIVEYAKLIRHFDSQYKNFASLDELEAILIARTFLLSLVLEDIEAALLTGLAKVLSSPGE
jgi:hypothetical protein